MEQTETEYPRQKTLFQAISGASCANTGRRGAWCAERNDLPIANFPSGRREWRNIYELWRWGTSHWLAFVWSDPRIWWRGFLERFQAGGAYVPLDPAYPKARLAFIAQDGDLRVILTGKNYANFFRPQRRPYYVLKISHQTMSGPRQSPSLAQAILAYVLYTSGSTGQPKGVALENRSAVAFVSWAKEVFRPEELAGVLAATSICFDLSVFELFVPLTCGGKIILADNALALPGLPAANEVTLVNTVPSAIRELLRIKRRAGVGSSRQFGGRTSGDAVGGTDIPGNRCQESL